MAKWLAHVQFRFVQLYILLQIHVVFFFLQPMVHSLLGLQSGVLAFVLACS